MDIIELQKIAKRYGFKNVLSFASWVEDNDLGEVLFGRDQEEIETGKGEIDKNSMKYRTTMLALDILLSPELKDTNLDNITLDQLLNLSRKVKGKKDLKRNISQ